MDEAGRKRLWDDYMRLRSSEIRESLILEYASLVKIVAGRLSMYLGYNVEREELESNGIFGLIDAIDKFDPRKGIKFETYASLRIRGAILDQVRKNDWIPRTVRQRQRQIDAAMRDIEAEMGRPATDEELAQALGISEDELLEWQGQMKATNIVSLNEFMETGGNDITADNSLGSRYTSPEEEVDQAELKHMLAEALDRLTEQERNVVLFYYYEDLTQKEIATVLSVTESRVSQLHTRALQKMRGVLGDYVGILSSAI
jgi:RNA polymerase sigma factor for flagellar operon FliA